MDITSLPDAHLRIFDRPPVPETGVKRVYLVSICGTGMGSLAGLFKQAGYDVSGSDQNVYPPMSTHLANAGIVVHKGYDPGRLSPPPDLVVIGNACTPTHVEATYAREEQLVQLSFPETLSHFFLSARTSLVVAGTHGKTTTTGLAIHLFRHAGYNPGFLVGGIMKEDDTSYALGTGTHFIVEGDEYDSAYFDKNPKFLHYRPSSAIVTSMELDHTDIYPDWETYRRAFESFVHLIPKEGTLVLCYDYDAVAKLTTSTEAQIWGYGIHKAPPKHMDRFVTAQRTSVDATGQWFILSENRNEVDEFFLPMHGDHNLSNALAAYTLARTQGIPAEKLKNGLATFEGLKRRQEVREEVDNILVLDDFAHHPTAVRETLKAVKQAYPERRLIAVFEPRSNSSRRKDFQEVYVEAFDCAQEVLLRAPLIRHNDSKTNMLDSKRLVEDLIQRGIPSRSFAHTDQLLPFLLERSVPGDVVLIMSNGGFDGLHDKFLAALRNRVQYTS